MMQVGSVAAPRAARAPVARADAAFPWYIAAALGVAVGGGFALALLVPLAVALGWDWGLRWRPLVQAHGHLQVGGWIGLFIVGIGYRLVPRFASRPLFLSGATAPTLALLLFGLIGRAAAQPWLDISGTRVLLTLAALAELAGTALFAVSVVRTLAPATRSFAPAPLLMLGAAGMVAQAALGAWWLPRLTADAPVLPADRNGALLSLQFFAFQIPFVLGVSMQALPRFFAYRHPTPARILPVAASLAAGSALHAGTRLLLDGGTGVRLEQTGTLLIALAIGGTILQTGVWRAPDRLRRSARNAAVMIRTAYAWLTLVVLVLLLTSTTALVTGEPVPPYQADVVRHLLAIGVFSTMIMAMAQLMLPWLAMRRQRGQSSSIEVWTLWGLWTSATVLRVAGALLEGQGVGAVRYWPMAVAGLLGLVALAFFAVTLLRAARTRPPEIPVHALDQRVSST